MATETKAQSSATRVPLAALLTASFISLFGGNFTFIAIPWFVLQTTGSASKTGLVAVAATLPVMVAGLFGGTLVDRVGFKRMSILADLLSGLTTALIPLLHHTVGLAFWQLLALVFLGAIFDAPGYTARAGLLPDLAGLAGARLERANATAQASRRLSQVLGPPAAGVLIAIVGTSNVLWIDAASFAISAAIVAALVPEIRRERSVEPAARPAYLEELREGLRFIRGDRLILAMMVTAALGAALAEPLYAIVLPVYSREVLGSAVDLGLIYSALAIGSLAGNVIYGTVGFRLSRRWLFLVGWVVRAVSFWIFVATPGLGTIVAMMIVNGLLFEPTNPLFQTIMQERVPADLRGRVFGAFESLAFGAMPLGILAYGYALEGLGLQSTLLLLAVANVLPVLSMLAPWAWRELGEPSAVAPLPDGATTG